MRKSNAQRLALMIENMVEAHIEALHPDGSPEADPDAILPVDQELQPAVPVPSTSAAPAAPTAATLQPALKSQRSEVRVRMRSMASGVGFRDLLDDEGAGGAENEGAGAQVLRPGALMRINSRVGRRGSLDDDREVRTALQRAKGKKAKKKLACDVHLRVMVDAWSGAFGALLWHVLNLFLSLRILCQIEPYTRKHLKSILRLIS